MRECNGMKHTMRSKPKVEFWWGVLQWEDLLERRVDGS